MSLLLAALLVTAIAVAAGGLLSWRDSRTVAPAEQVDPGEGAQKAAMAEAGITSIAGTGAYTVDREAAAQKAGMVEAGITSISGTNHTSEAQDVRVTAPNGKPLI
jgi:hypothetical protein